MKIFGMVSTRSSVEYTDHALDSFFRTTPLAPEDRFRLIDNDGSYPADSLSRFPRCSYLRNGSPLGFAANVNQLIAEALPAGADLYFLNNDVIFTDRWLAPLDVDRDSILSPLCNREVQYASSVVVPKTAHVMNLLVLNVSMNLADYLGNEGAFAAIVEAHRKAVSGFLQVYMLPFFCVKIPHRILSALGKFDEAFGRGGGEDFDYCLRAYLAGFQVEYALPSYCLHFGGKSSWSGAESDQEQARRVEGYRNVFLEKWGEGLRTLILREDHKVVDDVESLKSRETAGDLSAVIQSLLGDKKVSLKIA